MKDIIKKYFETKHFPEELCTIQNPREYDVMDSDVLFQVVLQNKNFPNSYKITLATPYVAKDTYDDNYGKEFYGWTSYNGDYLFNHFENNIHNDPEVVIAWRKVEENSIKIQSQRNFPEETTLETTLTTTQDLDDDYFPLPTLKETT